MILLYTLNRSYKDYKDKVKRELWVLENIGLNFNPIKCEFSIKTVKYLSFIL